MLALLLASASLALERLAPARAAWPSSWSYVYDTRGNRTKTQQYGATGYDFFYADSAMPDRLTRMGINNGTTSDPILAYARNASGVANVPVKSGRSRDYTYDKLGRVTAITGPFGYIEPFHANGQSQVTGSETVLRYVNTPGGAYNYYYDAQNRRNRKQHPNGDIEGFFWSGSKELVMETAPTTVNAVERTMDEYIWLAGRAVLSLRSLFGREDSWAREGADWETSCARRSEAGTCRPNAIITDVIGKPVATVDSERRLSGVLEYDPYGRVNAAEHWGEIAPHQNSGCWWVSSWMKQGDSSLVREVRAVLPRADIPNYTGNGGGCIGQYKSNPSQNPYGAPAGNDTCGPKQNFKFGWTTLADTEGLHVLYCSYDNNLSPQPFGVTVSGYDYKKYEAASVHYVPPFRFPGQYFDEETGFHENWNRYYDPSTGRYLSPEPLLQNPTYVRRMAQSGLSVPVYSYAANNPIRNTDPTGLYVSGQPYPETPTEAAATAAVLAYPPAAAAAVGLVVGAAIGYFGPWDPWAYARGPSPTPEPTPAPTSPPPDPPVCEPGGGGGGDSERCRLIAGAFLRTCLGGAGLDLEMARGCSREAQICIRECEAGRLDGKDCYGRPYP